MSSSDEEFRDQWASAFAAQSLSDYCVFLRLRFLRRTGEASLEVCHELHYLQMACEKIAKAYRLRDTTVDITSEMSGHVAFSKFIESYLISAGYRERKRYQGKSYLFTALKNRSKRNAREIEKLAPSVDSEETPANAEYPWRDVQEIKIPCRYSYPNLYFLTTANPEGIEFLQVVQSAIEGFTGKQVMETEGNVELKDKSQE